MKFSKFLFFIFTNLLISILLVHPVDAKVYKYKDENGKTHYTDSLEKIPYKYRKDFKPSKTNKSINQSRQGLDYRITSKSFLYGPYGSFNDNIIRTWKLRVKNNNSFPMKFNAKILLMDSTGAVIHRGRMYNLHIPKNTTKVFTEYADLKRSVGESIKKVSAEINNEKETQKLPIKFSFVGIHGVILRNLSQKSIVFDAKILFLDKDGYAIGRRFLAKEYLKAKEDMKIYTLQLLRHNPLKLDWKKFNVLLRFL